MRNEGLEKLTEIISKALLNAFAIARYLEKVPHLINKHISELESDVEKKRFSKITDKSQLINLLKSAWNGLVDIGVNVDKIHLPNYFNSSALLLVYSMLEELFRELGIAARELSGTKLHLNDINETNDVKKAKIYLEKHIEIDFTGLNDVWSKIDIYTQVRNAIIHRNSKINENDNSKNARKLKEHLEADNRISFEEGRFFITDTEYVKEFSENSMIIILHIAMELIDKFEDDPVPASL